MKTNTQNFTLLMALLCITIFAASCTSADIYKKEELNGVLKEKIGEHIDTKTKVTKMIISCGGNNSVNGKIRSVTIYYNATDGKRRVAYIPIDILAGSFEDKEDIGSQPDSELTGEEGRYIKDYDYSAIATNVQKAAEIATSKGYPASGVNTYTIAFYNDPISDRHIFSILCKEGKGLKMKGKQIVAQYYEFQCEADSKGNVTIPDMETAGE